MMGRPKKYNSDKDRNKAKYVKKKKGVSPIVQLFNLNLFASLKIVSILTVRVFPNLFLQPLKDLTRLPCHLEVSFKL